MSFPHDKSKLSFTESETYQHPDPVIATVISHTDKTIANIATMAMLPTSSHSDQLEASQLIEALKIILKTSDDIRSSQFQTLEYSKFMHQAHSEWKILFGPAARETPEDLKKELDDRGCQIVSLEEELKSIKSQISMYTTQPKEN